VANNQFSKFGSYSISTHNQNKRNTGYNNALYEDWNFSTTLGANFSTVVGSSVSTTGGLSNGVTLGGKIDLISPFSIKSVAGRYDYDFKACVTQVKKNYGTVYNTTEKAAIEHNLDGSVKVDPVEKCFIKESENWNDQQTTVAKKTIRKVLEGDMTYETVTTTVTGTCKTTAGGGASKMQMDISQINLKTINFAVDATVVSIKGTGNAKIEAATISIG
jgi:hypothetical protein